MLNSKAILRIIAPSIICVILIGTTKMGLDYYPLSFGLIIGIINWGYYNNKLGSYFGLVLSLIASYASFFIAYFSWPLIVEIFYFLGQDQRSIVGMFVSVCIIAPVLVFLSYKLVFNYKIKTNFNIIIIVSSIILLLLIFYIHNHLGYEEMKKDFSEFLNPYTLWQVIMALALQLIIHQKDLIKKLPN